MHNNNVFSKALQNAGIGITNKKQYQICGRYYGINVWKSSGGEENSRYGFNAHGEETGLKINVAKTKLLKCSKDSDPIIIPRVDGKVAAIIQRFTAH